MQTAIKQKLESIRSKSAQVYCNSQDISEICSYALEELTCYGHIISDFFSYNNEAVRIKTLYKKLRELDYTRNKVIQCIKVSRADHSYNDYFDGMFEFINSYINAIANDSTDIFKKKEQLKTAIQADPLFIESLFGGKNNEVVEIELTEAIQNIEHLVDFFEHIKEIKKTIESVAKRVTPFSAYDDSVNIVRLIANSAGLFCNRVIDEIMTTYINIHKSLDDKPVKPIDNTFKVF